MKQSIEVLDYLRNQVEEKELDGKSVWTIFYQPEYQGTLETPPIKTAGPLWEAWVQLYYEVMKICMPETLVTPIHGLNNGMPISLCLMGHSDPENAGYEEIYIGTVTICQKDHHLQLIRVYENVNQRIEAARDPHARFDDLQKVHDGAVDASEINGLPGEWAVLIYPYMQ